MANTREVTLRRCKVDQFNGRPPVDADFLGMTLDSGCDQCGGGDPYYFVVKCDGNLYIEVVHKSRVTFDGPAPYLS